MKVKEVKKSLKEKVVDTFSNISCSLAIGIPLDYASGLDTKGVIASRASATVINALTGAPYGMWRDLVFKKTDTREDSGRLRKTLVDLLAFNTFNLPIYAAANSIGNIVSRGHVDFDTVRAGVAYLAMISPVIGPTFGAYYDLIRKIFGLKSASQKAGEQK